MVATADYVRSRQSPSGGFWFYRSHLIEEPNLAGTYHAVASLRLLGVEPPQRERIAEFAARAAIYGPTYCYFQWMTLDLLGLATQFPRPSSERVAELAITAPDASRRVATHARLESTLQILTLQQALGISDDYPPALEFLKSHNLGGGFGDSPNLGDTSLALRIMVMPGALDAERDIAACVDLLQRPAIGFATAPHSSACRCDTSTK